MVPDKKIFHSVEVHGSVTNLTFFTRQFIATQCTNPVRTTNMQTTDDKRNLAEQLVTNMGAKGPAFMSCLVPNLEVRVCA